MHAGKVQLSSAVTANNDAAFWQAAALHHSTAEMMLHSGKVQLSSPALANNDACYSLLLCSLEGLASGQENSHTIQAEADLTI